MKVPELEPLLLKVRPNPLRAMRMLDRQHPSLRAISAESRDNLEHSTHPISFRVGYVYQGKMDKTTITFTLNDQGDWMPDNQPLP